MRVLLEQAPDIDAVFASNDQIALGAMGIAHQVGRLVPQDLAIVGFDNIPGGSLLLAAFDHDLPASG